MEISIIKAITTDTLKSVLEALKNVSPNEKIIFNIDSDGGEVFAAISIINATKLYNTEAHVLGHAASAAALLALSCDIVKACNNSMFLIHSISGSDDAELIKKLNNTLQKPIIKGRFLSASLLNGSDNWFTAKEMLNVGAIDEIVDGFIVNSSTICAKFNNTITNEVGKMEEKEKEKECKKVAECGSPDNDEKKPVEASKKAEADKDVGEEKKPAEAKARALDEGDAVEQLIELVKQLSERVEMLEKAAKQVESKAKAHSDSLKAILQAKPCAVNVEKSVCFNADTLDFINKL